MRVVVADLVPRFPEKIRQRGSTYFVSDAVHIEKKSRDEILATVDGTHRYVTGLSMDGRRLTLSCDCPYFLTDGPCKHLWATILAAERIGALAAMPRFDKIRLDQDRGSDEGDQDDVVAGPVPSPMLAAYRRASAEAQHARPAPRPWK